MLKPRGYKVITTWAMATAPQRDSLWGTRCLIWEAADPYLYLRTTVDDRIIVGGEDEEFSDEAKRDRLIPLKMAAIRRKLAKLLPGVATEAEFEWTGSFGVSDSSLPGIGPVPGARTALFDGELERDGEKGFAHEEGFVSSDRFGRRLGDDDAAGGVELRCGDLPEGAFAHLQVEARHQVPGEFRVDVFQRRELARDFHGQPYAGRWVPASRMLPS